MAVSSLYEQDVDAWTKQTVELLRAGRFQEVDVPHLIEELQDMSKRDRRELVSRLMVLVAHLLKWQYQPQPRSSGWIGSIVEQRLQIEELLSESPSLRGFLEESVQRSYPGALRIASREMQIPENSLPPTCPYRIAYLLDEDYYPPTP